MRRIQRGSADTTLGLIITHWLVFYHTHKKISDDILRPCCWNMDVEPKGIQRLLSLCEVPLKSQQEVRIINHNTETGMFAPKSVLSTERYPMENLH